MRGMADERWARSLICSETGEESPLDEPQLLSPAGKPLLVTYPPGETELAMNFMSECRDRDQLAAASALTLHVKMEHFAATKIPYFLAGPRNNSPFFIYIPFNH